MPRAKKAKPWEAIFRRIQCRVRADWVYAPKTTASDLDAAEAELEFAFPTSYRAFAEEFGLHGTFHGLPAVLPLFTARTEGASVLGSTREARDFYQEEAEENEGLEEHSALFGRMVVFAEDPAHETWAFDPADVTDARWRECRIYSIDRTDNVAAIADSFGAWVLWIDENFRFHEPETEDYPSVLKPASSDPRPIPYTWDGFVREKQVPEAAELKRWLAWNNGTVVALARSIRDEGRPNTFPVLADALEEAGCINADLLHSCRAGDPDIDGAWALAVLLETEAPAH